MYVIRIATLSLLLLVQNDIQGCSGTTHIDSQEQARLDAALEDISQSLKLFAHEMKEGLRLHKQNVDALRPLNSLSTKVDTLTQAISELKSQMSFSDQKIDTLKGEILDLKTVHIDKSETEETQQPVDWTRECEKQPHLEKIKPLVQAYINNSDFGKLKRGMDTVIDRSSEEYTKLKHADTLFEVGYYGLVKLATLLLCAGLPVDSTNRDGNTMLHGAAHGEHVHLVKLLLERGAAVNARGYNDWTPLIEAALDGDLEVVQVLVQAGADTSAKDKNGNTALDKAKSLDHKEVVEFLEQFPQ